MVLRKRLTFEGDVQGVGFRYRACMAADHYGCTGWILNLWDGRVIMEIQGEEEAIDAVLAFINAGTYVRIEEMRCKRLPLDQEETGFWVREEEDDL